MSRDIVLQDCKLPILTLQKYQSKQQHSNNTFVITTMDKYVFILQSNKQYDSIMHKFRIQSPANCVCLDEQLSILWLGCINGYILKYDKNIKSLRSQKYVQSIQQRPQLLCIYRRSQTVFGWNLNSEVILINSNTMQIKNRLSFGFDITCAIYLNNNTKLQMQACIAFQNNLPPFIFDCDTGTQIFDAYMQIRDNYLINQQLFDQQIVLISDQKNKPDCNFIICATIEHRSILQYYICQYSIHQQQNYKICQLEFKIQLDDLPIYIDFYQHYLTICYWSHIKILSLEERKYICTISTKYLRWGLAMSIQKLNNQVIYLMFYSKGFNFWQPDQSKKSKTNIHIDRKVNKLRNSILQMIKVESNQ